MELRHLRYFIAVAEELHFGRAAARLNIAQPPLSQQIRRLEDELGMRLLERTKRRVNLTDAGRVFLEEARATVAQAERAVRRVQRLNDGPTGTLAVGCVPWADFTSVPKAIRTFGQLYSAVDLELHSLTAPEQIAGLRSGRIQVGITRPPSRTGEFLTAPLFAESLVAVFARRHPLAAFRRVPWRELERYPYIGFSAKRAPFYQSVVSHMSRQAGIVLQIRSEADHPQTVLALVEAGLGFSLVPLSAALMRRPRLEYRVLAPRGQLLQTVVAWRLETESPAVRAFVSLVREVASRPISASRSAG